ncbi:hypothetical protein RBA41_23265 [Massilia sp. CCM 9210]|uniref:hypothetical protein n=1 Tax=Massilia scottii TaxID=3057166 RepID=UPI0027968B1A|nr:hypothetical protein [Massilia sp. CCM 9210]MDQ1816224.1 hypothetical protein [Massilia sp. CCM 9210]
MLDKLLLFLSRDVPAVRFGVCKGITAQQFQFEIFSIIGVMHIRRSDDKFFVSKIENRLISTLILSLSLTLAACHYYPVAADDFSVLDNDVLSDLVRNSHGSGNQTGGSYGVNGPGRLDKSKLELLVKNLFAEQELIKIETTFVTNGGACLTGQV